MVFFRWIFNLFTGLWHVLDFDPFGLGINLNIFLLSLSLFSLFFEFFRSLADIQKNGLGKGFDNRR